MFFFIILCLVFRSPCFSRNYSLKIWVSKALQQPENIEFSDFLLTVSKHFPWHFPEQDNSKIIKLQRSKTAKITPKVKIKNDSHPNRWKPSFHMRVAPTQRWIVRKTFERVTTPGWISRSFAGSLFLLDKNNSYDIHKEKTHFCKRKEKK